MTMQSNVIISEHTNRNCSSSGKWESGQVAGCVASDVSTQLFGIVELVVYIRQL